MRDNTAAPTAGVTALSTGDTSAEAAPKDSRGAASGRTDSSDRKGGSAAGAQDRGKKSESGGRARTDSAGRSASKRITSDEALDNTRRLLAAKKARARTTPAWQAHDDTHPPGHVPAPGFESASARDHADALHQGEMHLKGIEGSINEQDRRNQGKRDSR